MYGITIYAQIPAIYKNKKIYIRCRCAFKYCPCICVSILAVAVARSAV